MKDYDAVIWTDGSCSKDGCGGAAAVLVSKKGKRLVVHNGSPAPTTNQRMELWAAIIGLNQLWWRGDRFESARIRRTKRVLLYSDSAYLTNCFIQQWIPTWRARGWKKADGKPVKNQEFWETLENFVEQFREVVFIHVKGHAGNSNNELADHHAVLARTSMQARAINVEREGADPEEPVKRPFPKPHGIHDARTTSRTRKKKPRASYRV